MAFPEKFIQDLIDRSDITDVVSSYVRLTKRSGANQFGLCPFHSEKTASFSVNRDKQMYYCFGCHKGGGVINFIMEVENLSYPDAVAFLARRAGMQVPEETDSAESRKRVRMLAMNADAARWFHSRLSEPEGEAARTYIARRGISPAMTKNFGLGAAPDSWDGLRSAMHEKGYSDQELFAAGLVKKGRNGGFYDAFRNRLMFPVIDVRGEVIGFSGRILSGDGPKYVNSPDTPVYDKGRNLFALNLAKKSKSGYLILVEGNIDVVSLHQAGFDSAVASLGTALTDEQARLISRYTNEVVLAYDGDSAGMNATQKAIHKLEKLDVRVRVLRVSGAKDPDEFIQKRGAAAFRKLIEDSENQTDYQLNSVLSRYDLSVDEQKVEYVRAAAEILAGIPDPVRRQVFAMRVAGTAGLKEDVVTGTVERLRRERVQKGQRSEQREMSRPEKLIQPAARNLRYEDPESAAAEEGLVRLLTLDPSLIRTPGLPPASDFTSPNLGKIYDILCKRIRNGDAVSVDLLSGELTGDEMSLLVSVLQKPENLSSSSRAAADYIAKIQKRKERRTGATDLRNLARQLREEKGYEG